MEKSERTFTIEVGKSTIIGISEESTLTIVLRGGKTYRAQVEKNHATMARWHAKEHPIGKKRRRLLTSSEQLRRLRKEHPDDPRLT
jgi:hypothetical protein